MRATLLVISIAACDGGGSATPDAAYDTARCLIRGHYGALGAVTGTDALNMGSTTVTVTIDPGPPRDTFFVKLTPGRGVFSAGLAPGTYPIAGVDAGYATCGLCVHIIADINPGSGPSKFYFADAGMVTITSTDTAGPVNGSAQGLHLAEVDISTGGEITDGCEATIASVMWTTM
jgi:hypothetical protein